MRSDSGSRKTRLEVGRVLVWEDAAPFEERTQIALPDIEEWTHVMAAPGRHAAKAGQPTSSQQMKDNAFYDVVGGMRERDEIRACIRASPLEKFIAQRSCARLQRAFGKGRSAALGDEADAQARAELFHLKGHRIRALAQRVVVVSGHDVTSGLVQGDQERGRIWAARDGHKDPSEWKLSHGGAGWTRTTDNAIMSRALYHLSYGTA